MKGRVVFITGASSGIGAACAYVMAREGASLVLIARRWERLTELKERLEKDFRVSVHIGRVDVRNREEVESFIRQLPSQFRDVDVLINNAGLARGLDPIYEGESSDWEEMIETNLKGLLWITRALLPGMIERNRGHIVNIGSIAGRQVYPRGNVYCATKFAVWALTQALLMELVDKPIRVTTIDPGMVQTEFSLVRFKNNRERASQTYQGITPLKPEDVAEAVLFALTRPPYVNISEMVILPTHQASVYHIYKTL